MAIPDTTKARLVEAAGREFAEKGFELARIRTICDRAGANLAAVNYHFGDKEQLYRAVLLEAYKRRSSVVTPTIGDVPPAEKLRAFIRFFFEQVVAGSDEDTWQAQLIMREIFSPTSALDAVIQEWIRPRFELLKSIVREIRPEADDRRLNVLCFSIVGQCLMYRMTREVTGRLIGPEGLGRLDIAYLADHVATFSLAALGLGPPAGRDADPRA
ncbi:CerR family C-terminal domain-containing protein [Paludisphaera mucosa]|uniref:CerR family C-terminal domain-containing protein n=1 Tax=Paludisphaera mucosa TaxID=3030827 RepID=A0ABT6F8P8_9BACT|nr:CerR family C-terminal domain-containing protein [Paludisphaera mucosa]MDG3003967.1 CerR family C-terminal domain-containing protein [Paludisphaera mucosa]